jgi:hypothetical protein
MEVWRYGSHLHPPYHGCCGRAAKERRDDMTLRSQHLRLLFRVLVYKSLDTSPTPKISLRAGRKANIFCSLCVSCNISVTRPLFSIFTMRQGMFARGFGLLLAGFAAAAPSARVSSSKLVGVRDSCHSPSNRACWSQGFDVSTDYEDKVPDTGVTRIVCRPYPSSMSSMVAGANHHHSSTSRSPRLTTMSAVMA